MPRPGVRVAEDVSAIILFAMLCEPEFWVTNLIAIGVAVAVPLTIEAIRRPRLIIETAWKVSAPPLWSIVHLRVRNLRMRERWWLPRFAGKWLTAFPADGCVLHLTISKKDDPSFMPHGFDGKWSSRPEPVSYTAGGYDPQKLAGISEVSLQPGRGDLVAVAIRPSDSTDAYSFQAPLVYNPPTAGNFPVHPAATLSPGVYEVEAVAAAGDVESKPMTFTLTVYSSNDDLDLD